MMPAVILWLMLASAHSAVTPNDRISPQILDQAPPQKTQSEQIGLFGSHEIMSRQLSAFKKWNRMIARNQKDPHLKKTRKAGCRKRNNHKCYVDDWHDLIAFLRNKPEDQQITEINNYINKSPYITDIINWGISDYWESLLQFLKKDGDCEDYAIAKYLSLKELGFDPDKMRIVVVQDTNLDIAHAILVVFNKDDHLILDNQIPYVVKEKAVLHYRPFYSINEHAWWLHSM